MLRTFLILSINLLLFSCGTTSDSKAEVYILAGQSNMQGIGKLDKIPKSYQAKMNNVKFWTGKKFATLDPNFAKISTRMGEFGPEIGFAKVLSKVRPNKTIYIIKYHASGMPLHHGWNGNRWIGEIPKPLRVNFYGGTGPNDPNRGSLYKKLSKKCQDALAALKASGVSYKVAGIVWMQGEQDSKNAVSADEYAKSLKTLKTRLQEDTASGDIPFVFGQVLPHEPALMRFGARRFIRRSMANAQWNSGHKDAIPNVWMVPTDGMPLKKDTVHYDAHGQLILGVTFGLKMIEAQGK